MKDSFEKFNKWAAYGFDLDHFGSRHFEYHHFFFRKRTIDQVSSTASEVGSSTSGDEVKEGGKQADKVRYHREIKLTSILNLQQSVEVDTHKGLREIFKNHTFVGCVNAEYALLQHQTKLYLINTSKLR